MSENIERKIQWLNFQREVKKQEEYKRQFCSATGEPMPPLDDRLAWLRFAVQYGVANPENASPDLIWATVVERAEQQQAEEGVPQAAPWTPPHGYVGVKDICNDARFRKNGKNPPRTTIDVWISTDKLKVVKDPATQEVHVPTGWIVDRISRWTPRT